MFEIDFSTDLYLDDDMYDIPQIDKNEIISKLDQEYDKIDIPNLNKTIKPKSTNNKKANFATKLFDSKNSLVPKVPLFVENELNAPL